MAVKNHHEPQRSSKLGAYAGRAQDLNFQFSQISALPAAIQQDFPYGVISPPTGAAPYESDGSRTLKIVFENVGEIDFICAPSLTGNPTVKAEVRGRDVLLETPAEIIAKKIYYRGGAMQPRDMFDIACVVRTHGEEYLNKSLAPFHDKCEAALKVARRMNPQFAETIMTKLLSRESFSDIPRVAQAMTIELLNHLH
ncbi:hypothetical protein ABIA24_004442 [Sinorhizobium fredii]|uniref:hypothetical protein n=1 Tax=Rhizobium fredii TaxID=380 RepID=UPI00210F0A9C|nr:hypothetical protein [Sinorhizobium fredii]